ncbi:MAG TPA: hypothetical protein VFJ07_22175 [Streptosporangiaceae bacterium]|nr:hypothetical protein [Streptosporangiaceae bacterium]
MGRADPDRSGHPAAATAGTLDSGEQAAEATGQTQGQAEGTAGQAESGPAGTRPSWRRAAVPHPRQAVTGATGVRGVLRSPVAKHIGILLCFIAAGALATIPLAANLAGRIPAARDPASYVWDFWWVAHQVTHLGNPWFTPLMAAPVGVQLGFHTMMPLPGVLFTPITLAFGPAFSYNLWTVILPGLLCYATYRAARLWLRSATGAAGAAVFFGLSCMLTQQDWYHLNIALGAMFLPMALEASVRLRRKPGRRQAIILGLVMGAAVLCDQESAVLAAIVVALVLLPWLLRHPGWPRMWPVLLACVTGTVLASPQIIAMLQEIVGSHGGLSIPPPLLAVSYKQYGIGLPGMFTPTPRVATFGLDPLASPFLHGRDNEGMPMFGTTLTVLALLGLIASWRRRSAWQLAALWIGCAALALGTSLWIGKHQYLPLSSVWNGVRVSNLMPYTWFVRLPGLSSFREADRLAILGLLPAALLAGAAVEWCRYHAKPLLAVIAAAAILESGYSGTTPKVGSIPVSYPGVDQGILKDHSNSIVLDLPFGLRGGIPVDGVPFFPQALVMATEDGHPRSIAYTSRVPGPTINAINGHPFYYALIHAEHEVAETCPFRAPGQKGSLNLCDHPYGVSLPGPEVRVNQVSEFLSPKEIAAAKRDAAAMNIRWAVVWKRNGSVSKFLLTYLHETGFNFAYLHKIHDKDTVLVYKRA